MNAATPRLLDAAGNPIPPATFGRRRGAVGTVPYTAASYDQPETQDWSPYLGSPDAEINPNRNPIVARIRDMVRNDGWAAGSVTPGAAPGFPVPVLVYAGLRCRLGQRIRELGEGLLERLGA